MMRQFTLATRGPCAIRALVALLAIGFAPLFYATADAKDDLPALAVAPSHVGGHALIIAGLPGDAKRAAQFDATVRKYCDWLTGPLQFAPANVHVLSGTKKQEAGSRHPATREAVRDAVAGIQKSLRPDDRLWVFFVGHANFDGRHAWLHLPGHDLNEQEFGKLFSGITCREQVFWITSSESGRFLRPLSAKGRVVVTATRTKGEVNETEFPHALATVVERPFYGFNAHKAGHMPLLYVYYLVLNEIQSRYDSDKRAPTEHALFDDNGDGRGTERPLTNSADRKKKMPDGLLASKLIVPSPVPPPTKRQPEAPLEPLRPIPSSNSARR